jgi:hypothetical protein
MSEQCIDAAFYWTPEEAAAIIDYLDRLRDTVWSLYAQDIITLRQVENDESASIDETQQELDFGNECTF